VQKPANILLILLGVMLGMAERPAAAQDIREFPIPSFGCDPESIVLGPDGAFWFTEYWTGAIGRITLTGTVTEYYTPTGTSHPVSIVVGPDTNLWFTESTVGKIGRITTNGTITEFPCPANTVPVGIALGPDSRLWVTDAGPNFVAGMATNGGIMAFTVGGSGLSATNYYNTGITVHNRPGNITAGPDGNLWFTERLVAKIGLITTAGVITEFPLPGPTSQPYDIVTGPDGALWFTEFNSNKLGRITTAGALTEYSLPTNSASANQPWGITVGSDSNLWYSDISAGWIGRFTLTNVTTFATPSLSSRPRRLAAGPDGSIWFGEFIAESISGQDFIGRYWIPPLTVTTASGSRVILTWPTTAGPTFHLQSNTNLAGTNWVNVLGSPATIGSNFVVTNSATNSQLFFRISQ
jgi:virginiamycin B lyase